MSRFKDDEGWTLFDYDFATGTSTWMLTEGNKVTFKTETPVDNILKANEEAYINSLSQNWGNGRKVASVPLNVFYDQLGEAHSCGDQKYIDKWMNDADNAAFRTFKGRV